MIKKMKEPDLYLSFKMKTYIVEDLKTYKFDKKKRNVIMGFFDGVHIGHQKIIKSQIKQNITNTIITFDFHLNKESIMTLDQKIDKLSTLGIDEVIILMANSNNLKITYEKFNLILKDLNVISIGIGRDFKYGHMGCGSADTLEKDFDLTVYDFVLDDSDKISSSNIRKLIKEGNIKKVNKLLGSDYTIKGYVVMGKQIGRTINFPTANIKTNNIAPKNGIYGTNIKINDKIYKSITNVGIRPTIDDDNEISIEVHILDFDQDIYGMDVELSFINFIRCEMKFNSLDELKLQIKKDIESMR